jgi:hypothetical protein
MLHQREAVIAWAIIFNHDLVLLYSYFTDRWHFWGYTLPVLLA